MTVTMLASHSRRKCGVGQRPGVGQQAPECCGHGADATPARRPPNEWRRRTPATPLRGVACRHVSENPGAGRRHHRCPRQPHARAARPRRRRHPGPDPAARPLQDKDVRFATFNASLNRNNAGDLVRDLSTPDNAQAAAVAETIQRTDPDVLLINEFDYVEGGRAAELFRDNYLAVPHNGAAPVDYPYYYVAPVNTGVPSGLDLDNNGTVGGPNDAYGFGFFPGQYGMAVFSKYPIADRRRPHLPAVPLEGHARRPAARRPGDRRARRLVLRRRARRRTPLRQVALGRPDPDRRRGPCTSSSPTRRRRSSTVPRTATAPATSTRSGCGPTTSRPTAPATSTTTGATYGGLPRGSRFVIAGDQNSDPLDGDSIPGSAQQLLDTRASTTVGTPSSDGAVEAAERAGRRQRSST